METLLQEIKRDQANTQQNSELNKCQLTHSGCYPAFSFSFLDWDYFAEQLSSPLVLSLQQTHSNNGRATGLISLANNYILGAGELRDTSTLSL